MLESEVDFLLSPCDSVVDNHADNPQQKPQHKDTPKVARSFELQKSEPSSRNPKSLNPYAQTPDLTHVCPQTGRPRNSPGSGPLDSKLL